jgi:hypothetical protein
MLSDFSLPFHFHHRLGLIFHFYVSGSPHKTCGQRGIGFEAFLCLENIEIGFWKEKVVRRYGNENERNGTKEKNVQASRT